MPKAPEVPLPVVGNQPVLGGGTPVEANVHNPSLEGAAHSAAMIARSNTISKLCAEIDRSLETSNHSNVTMYSQAIERIK